MKAVDVLRDLRTLAYRSLSPLERVFGSRQLPPLWLRRHVGDPAKFEDAARDTAAWLERLQLLSEKDVILDIGCGCGAMVPEFAQRLGPEGRYVGFDVHEPSIRWCQQAYADDARFTFEWASIESPYSSQPSSNSRPQADTYRFPLEDHSANLVLAKSVFTHLLEQETRHYLNEIARVLAPGGSALISFFLFDSQLLENGGGIPVFPHHQDRPEVRWRLAGHPHAAVAYSKDLAFELFDTAGLKVEHFIEGFWPGSSSELRGQDQLVVSRS